MGTPGANRSHDIIVWQAARSGVARSWGEKEREKERKSERAKAETRAPTVTHSASRGPSTRMDKS